MGLKDRTVSAVRRFLAHPMTKLMTSIVLFVIAIDVIWGGVFAGFAGNILGVVVVGFSVIQVIDTLMKLPAKQNY